MPGTIPIHLAIEQSPCAALEDPDAGRLALHSHADMLGHEEPRMGSLVFDRDQSQVEGPFPRDQSAPDERIPAASLWPSAPPATAFLAPPGSGASLAMPSTRSSGPRADRHAPERTAATRQQPPRPLPCRAGQLAVRGEFPTVAGVGAGRM